MKCRCDLSTPPRSSVKKELPCLLNPELIVINCTRALLLLDLSNQEITNDRKKEYIMPWLKETADKQPVMSKPFVRLCDSCELQWEPLSTNG